ncbi:N-acetylmuramoyl-L-alanine amidase [Streptomyces acidiscabies]|uniref:N-acetylmuramoyl-L-alanine amidase n=1 Tax=Streptomyces acidiscabies TaxID=42234 RepID=UPI00095233A0|nr:N-acetylmuramoyl-L-alanine amidase [Streptomyces acidiscabies]
MQLITRAQLGWGPSAAPTQTSTRGVKVHYLGQDVDPALATTHTKCIALWKAIRASHLANPRENYSDIAYNFGACPHGYLLEGRGIGKRTGANGDQPLNKGHYAVVGLIGNKGLSQPTDAMLTAIRDGIELLRQHGAGDEIQGHRDGYSTDCPGAPLYAWVKQGAPRPGAPTGPTRPVVDLSQLVAAARTDPPKSGTPVSYAGTRTVEDALVKEGLLAKSLADGHFGTATVTAYAAWQSSPAGGGFTGADADGIPGMTSLKLLAARHGFTVTL